MITLDNIKSGPGRLYIPAVYNSGRKAAVRVNLNETDKIHISIEDQPERPYQLTLDGYLHVNVESLESSASWQSVDDCKKAIDLIDKHFFSGTLVVFSDDKAIVDKNIDKDRSLTRWCKDIYDAFTDRKQSYFRKMLGGDRLSFIDRLSNAFQAAKKQKQRIEVVETLNHAHLGGTWILGK
jgi:hypothetical protein